MANTRGDGGVRPLRTGDEHQLADLWVLAWAETMPTLDFQARREWILDFLVGAEARSRMTLVATEAEQPVGFVTIEPGTDYPRPPAYLHQLAVTPTAKGKGAAARLLAAVKEGAPYGLMLDVNQANTRAVRFYEREGFLPIGAGVNQASGLATWRLAWRPV